jgi:hypothetical protein
MENTVKLHIRVIDIPATALAAEVETLLNEPYEAGFYLEKTQMAGLPSGVSVRAFYKIRSK